MTDPKTHEVPANGSEVIVTPGAYESLYFRLVLNGMGIDPKGFKFWKFAQRQRQRIKVWVFGRGSAAHYDVPDTESWTSLFAHDLKNGTFSPNAGATLNRDGLAVLRAAANELSVSGLRAALDRLNARVPHRFTALYRLADGVMSNVALVDKEKSLHAFSLQAVRLDDSFCQFALKDGHFVTAASGEDARLVGHPYAGVVRSYIGVPVADASTGLVGTLCHFDFKDHAVSEQEFFLLQRFALLLPAYLHTPVS